VTKIVIAVRSMAGSTGDYRDGSLPAAALSVVGVAGAGKLGFYWRTACGCRPLSIPVVWPSVAIVVWPARDEVRGLPATVPDVVAQDYPGPVRVQKSSFDDSSSDGTRELNRK